MNTTAIYPNRVEDKRLLESRLNLSEEGNNTTVFRLKGCSDVFAVGYSRIVYGDHGPYVEFHKINIRKELYNIYGGKFDLSHVPPNSKYYYYWLKVRGSAVKIYYQLKTVANLQNAPKRADGKPHRFFRKEGYADYKVDMLYVDPYDMNAETCSEV